MRLDCWQCTDKVSATFCTMCLLSHAVKQYSISSSLDALTLPCPQCKHNLYTPPTSSHKGVMFFFRELLNRHIESSATRMRTKGVSDQAQQWGFMVSHARVLKLLKAAIVDGRIASLIPQRLDGGLLPMAVTAT